MTSARRLAAALAVSAGIAVAPLITASPALAALPCEWSDMSAQPWNYPIDGVACVVLDTRIGIRLVAVTDVQPGWTYVGALVMLQLVQVPLAWSLARRLRQRLREREALLARKRRMGGTPWDRAACSL